MSWIVLEDKHHIKATGEGGGRTHDQQIRT